MVLLDLGRLVTRYWLVLALCAVCTAGAGWAVKESSDVYFTRTELTFLAPTSRDYPNALRTQSEEIIDTAGVVAKLVSGPSPVTKFASPDVTLIGLGIRDGWSLRLPDTGGQWASNFASQILMLEVVGPSREVVARRQTRLIKRVRQTLEHIQREAGVKPVNDITVMPTPQSTVIYQVGGARNRALGMTTLLGLGATLALVLFFDRRRRRRMPPLARTQVAQAVQQETHL